MKQYMYQYTNKPLIYYSCVLMNNKEYAYTKIYSCISILWCWHLCGAEVQSEREFTHTEELSGVWTAVGTAPALNSRTYIVFKLPHDPHAMLLSISYGYTHASLPCLPLAIDFHWSVFHWLLFFAHLQHVFQ